MHPRLSRSQVVAATIGIQLGSFLSGLDTSIVATAMPRIVGELAGLEYYAWVTTAYLMASATMVPISGKLGDLFGRKRMLLVGMTGFLLASVLCGLAQSMPQLVALRGLQGGFGGVLMASVVGAMADLYAPATRARMQGLFVGVWAVASILGPILGGYLTDGLGWRWAFYVNVPVGAAAFAITALTMPSGRTGGSRAEIDVAGALLLAGGLVPLLSALSLTRDHGLASPLVIGLLAVAAVMLVAFRTVEARQPQPIVPFALFRNQAFLIPVGVAFLSAIGLFGSYLFIPLVYQGVLGLSATRSGQMLVPMLVGLIASSLLTGQLITRVRRYRFVGAGGLATLAAGLLLLSRVTANSSEFEVLLDSLLVSVGWGVFPPLYQNVVMSAVPQALVGVAASQVQFWRTMGQAVGAALLGAVLAHQLPLEIAVRTAAFGTGVLDTLPPGLTSSEALVDPARTTAMRAGLSPDLVPAFDQLLAAMRQALASGLHDTFVVGAVFVVLAVVVSVFLKEIPFRAAR